MKITFKLRAMALWLAVAILISLMAGYAVGNEPSKDSVGSAIVALMTERDKQSLDEILIEEREMPRNMPVRQGITVKTPELEVLLPRTMQGIQITVQKHEGYKGDPVLRMVGESVARSLPFSRALKERQSAKVDEISAALFAEDLTYITIPRNVAAVEILLKDKASTTITWDDDATVGSATLNCAALVEPTYWREEIDAVQARVIKMLEDSGIGFEMATGSVGKACTELKAQSDEKFLQVVLGFRKEELEKQTDPDKAGRLAMIAGLRHFSLQHDGNKVYRYHGADRDIYVMPMAGGKGVMASKAEKWINIVEMNKGQAIVAFMFRPKRQISETDALGIYLGLGIRKHMPKDTGKELASKE